MFWMLFAPITGSATAADSPRVLVVWWGVARVQVLVWDAFSLKHGQLETDLWLYAAVVLLMMGANSARNMQS
jgi:hypothetical protein